MSRDRKIRTALRTNQYSYPYPLGKTKDSSCYPYTAILPQQCQLTVTPDAVSTPCQNCRTVGVLHNLQNNIVSQVRCQCLMSCDPASAVLVTSCLYLLAQSRSSKIRVSPSSIPNTAIKRIKTLLQQITVTLSYVETQ